MQPIELLLKLRNIWTVLFDECFANSAETAVATHSALWFRRSWKNLAICPQMAKAATFESPCH